MTFKTQTLNVVRLRDRRSQLIAGGTAIALAASTAGLLVGRSSAPNPQPATQQETPDTAGQPAAPADMVRMSPEAIADSGVAVEQIRQGSFGSEILAQATVKAPPEGQALLTARADGAVVRINKRLGDPVGAGETVALLESRDAAAFISERNATAAKAQAARAAAAREQRLFNSRVTARQDLEAALAAARTADAEFQRAAAAVQAAGVVGGRYLAVRSPITGRITEVDTQLGAYVSAGAELFNVSDPRRIQVEASVAVSDAQRIQPGDTAFVELPIGGIVDARVRSATPALDPQSRTATVVLELAGAPGDLRQGQAVRVRIIPKGGVENTIVVPEDAVQQVDGRDIIFVRVKDGFRAVPVGLGRRSAGRVEIVSGLQPGQTIAAKNAFVLKAELGKGAGDEE